jgi:hypothetical protein
MAHLCQFLEDRGRREVAPGVDGGIRRLAANQTQAADRGRGFLVRDAVLWRQPGDRLVAQGSELARFLDGPGWKQDRRHLDDRLARLGREIRAGRGLATDR